MQKKFFLFLKKKKKRLKKKTAQKIENEKEMKNDSDQILKYEE